MRIIGIDPGTATTGFSILERNGSKTKLLDYGCIRTAVGLKLSERLKQINEDLVQLIETYKPQQAAVEKLFFQTNVKTAISVAQARGVVLYTLAQYGIEDHEFTPLAIKSQICGNGKADKKMIQKMVKIILNLKVTPKPDDAADAIAVALCLANRSIIV